MLSSAATSRKSPLGPAFDDRPVTRSLSGHLALFTHCFGLQWPISDNCFQVIFPGGEERACAPLAAADTVAPGAAEVGNAATPAAGAKPPPRESRNLDLLNSQIHKNTQLQFKEGERESKNLDSGESKSLDSYGAREKSGIRATPLCRFRQPRLLPPVSSCSP